MQKQKTHWRKAFKSDYLSSCDVDGIELKLTIKHVRYESCTTQSGKKYCNVAHFVENYKPMILNVGNSKIVKKLAKNKPHIDDWVNIPIIVYVDANVRFANEVVEGLRIRPYTPSKEVSKKELSANQIEDAIKFIKGGKSLKDLKQYYIISEDMENRIKAKLDA